MSFCSVCREPRERRVPGGPGACDELVVTGSVCRLDPVSRALEELLVAAQRHGCLTLGVYESAKLMNV